MGSEDLVQFIEFVAAVVTLLAVARKFLKKYLDDVKAELLKDIQKKFDAAKTGLGDTKAALLKDIQERFDAVKAELRDIKTELDRTKTELGDTKAELGDTKAELGDTKTELDRTKTELTDVKKNVGPTVRKVVREELASARLIVAPSKDSQSAERQPDAGGE